MDEDSLFPEEGGLIPENDFEVQIPQPGFPENPVLEPFPQVITPMPTIAPHPEYMDDPNGGVIVRDIFGEEHHYADMNQAQQLTDFMTGVPIVMFPSMPPANTSSTDSQQEGHLPTDIHTPVDLTYYDNRIKDAQQQLDKALEDAARAKDAKELEDALNRQTQARRSMSFWDTCRTQFKYNQTISNIKSDRIINDANDALNKLHDTLYRNG